MGRYYVAFIAILFAIHMPAQTTRIINHGAQHGGAGGDPVTLDGTDAGTATTRTNQSIIKHTSHNDGCNTLTDGQRGEICIQEDTKAVWVCVPSSGGCDTPGEWFVVSSDGIAEGDIDTFAELNTIVTDAVLGRALSHATDCTARTDGNEGDICVELDDDTIYACQPSAGGCDTAGEWILLAGSGPTPVSLVIFGPGEEHATGDNKMCFLLSSQYNGANLTSVYFRLHTAGTTNTLDVQIRNATDAVDVLSTKATIDSGETSTATAATPPVINTANDDVATNDYWCIDIDAVHLTEGFGLTGVLGFTLP